ncbi:DNA/RNA non-specific endonuclease [Cryptobacterium curtum]|uniref:DNA/RNA non-specific endonuclease n=2 Tax=Cryptobacterium curtum TaxID=84163 RepID=UPI0002F8E1C6|nr:DNA/RNA non-specific endonuclease [Cryptobacterium curtum]
MSKRTCVRGKERCLQYRAFAHDIEWVIIHDNGEGLMVSFRRTISVTGDTTAHKVDDYVQFSYRRGVFAVMLLLMLSLVLVASGCSIPSFPNFMSAPTSDGPVDWTQWDEQTAPDYYTVEGPAQIPDDIPPAGQVDYSPLDALGRTGSAAATVDWDMIEESAGWRQKFAAGDNPSGWGDNAEVGIDLPDGRVYHGWFWNRSHLIADSLGGDAVRKNAVTGTRMQNVGANSSTRPGGMAYPETKVRDWLKDHQSETVEYAATPLYVGDELVPRAVSVDMRSSDGSIDEHVIVFNAAKGYSIDYHDGTFSPS